MENLILVSGDIIENANNYKAEAIVNPANEYMETGGGVCGAIYESAGVEQLETYCQNKWQNEMQVNEVRITTGFKLCKDIIHIHPPRAYEQKEHIEKLQESYIKLFESIKQENYKRIIIPSLGTGHYGYNHKEVAKMVMEQLQNFCKKNKDIVIIFNLYDVETKKIYEQYV